MQILHLKEIELHIHFIDYLYFTLLKINFKKYYFIIHKIIFLNFLFYTNKFKFN